ncbi:hypothetical protein DAEQUDRAFT_720378 [Daedalea quercina L-15889]|uniref:DUF423-domain-containing protein n=1 Tax=Daedalea quercina L-15889 TaxID=1314783 RepID=A0A165UN03_9APHY|nr:hypothetical protein DAEQUDRAFT_720378 [Daedalea quercina L-15889]
MASPFPNSRILWKTGALFTAVGMLAGAFGAHGLQKRAGITPENLRAWGSAAQYAVFNGLGLLLISMHPRFATHKFAGPAIAAGGFVFSSSIVALVLARDKFRWLGPITPIGGSLMIAGYIALAL